MALKTTVRAAKQRGKRGEEMGLFRFHERDYFHEKEKADYFIFISV